MKNIKRIALLIAGWVCLIVGIAGLFLPIIPGTLLIIAGVGLLSRQLPFFDRLKNKVKSKLPARLVVFLKAKCKT